MEEIKMDSEAISKSTYAETDTNCEIKKNKIVQDRLNSACEIIYKEYSTDQFAKVDRTITSSRKHSNTDHEY